MVYNSYKAKNFIRLRLKCNAVLLMRVNKRIKLVNNNCYSIFAPLI